MSMPRRPPQLHHLMVAMLAAITASTLTHAQQAQGDAATLPSITIQGARTEAELKKEELQEVLQHVPGGTNLIDLDEKRGSQSTIAKVLDFEPGIIVQEFFGGNDQPRLNIRGSGIQDNPVSRGIQLLQDGLPVNQADGSFIIGLLDPEQAQYVSVYRGSNALRYGGTTLGGAIDFSQRNALNSASTAALETGSWGAVKTAVSFGQRINDWDLYLRVARQQTKGWRAHSQAERNNLALNFGVDRGAWRNRTYVNLTDNQFDIPFVLTKARAVSDPRSVIGDYVVPGAPPSTESFLNVRMRRPMRDTQQTRVGHKTLYTGETFNASAGVYAEHITDKFKNPAWQADTKAKNIGLDASIDTTRQWFNGLDTRLEAFVSANTGSMPRRYRIVHPTTGELERVFGNVNLNAHNVVAGGQIIQNLTPSVQVLAALQYVDNTRKVRDLRVPGLLDSTFKYKAMNPKVGIIWTPRENQRYYANVSRSSEAPTFWQLVDLGEGSVPFNPATQHLRVKPLKMQEAVTFEIGTAHAYERMAWEATVFHSNIKRELIAEVMDFAIDGSTVNYDHDSWHQGVELAFNARTASGILRSGDHFTMRGVYNYSRFTFRGGRYQGKRVAGVPVHLIMGEVGYQFNEALGLSLSARWQPQDTHIDHSNGDLMQDKYLLLGANVTWKPHKQWELFLDVRNLTNQTYQTAYVVRGFSAEENSGGLATPSFVPGPERHFFAGVRFSF